MQRDLHLDEKTPHLHIDYIPITNGYKNGLETRNSQSVALQKMGFGKEKNSINEWRKQERQILRGICEKYGIEIAEEAKGELKSDFKVLDEIKDEIRADFEDELLSEQQHLLTEIKKHKREMAGLQSQRNTQKSATQPLPP